MLLGNVGVYPIKAFVVWMWGYNCLLNMLELKFLCYTTTFVFFCPAKTVSSVMELEKFLLNGLHLLIIGKILCPFLTLLQWANSWVSIPIDSVIIVRIQLAANYVAGLNMWLSLSAYGTIQFQKLICMFGRPDIRN